MSEYIDYYKEYWQRRNMTTKELEKAISRTLEEPPKRIILSREEKEAIEKTMA